MFDLLGIRTSRKKGKIYPDLGTHRYHVEGDSEEAASCLGRFCSAGGPSLCLTYFLLSYLDCLRGFG